MALTAYCGFDEVRAALGVNDIELSNAVLSLPVYEIGLVRELNKVSTSLPVAFSTVSAVAEESRSATQQALIDAVRFFSVYTAAKQVGVSLAAIMPKDVGDGKATLSRFAGDPYKDVMENVEAMCSAAKGSLVAALAVYNGTSSSTDLTQPVGIFSRSQRSYDPVTGA